MAGTGRIRSADHLLVPAVAETLSRLELAPEDAGVARLAESYARVIDDAALIASEVADLVPDDADTVAHVARLERRVEAHAVLAEIGPKLAAALEALGASPRARVALAKGKPPATGSGKLAALRGGRVS